jgi:hypothetical protein
MYDSSSSIEEFYQEKLMERSREERFMMGVRIFETARSMVLASLPANLFHKERSFNLFLRFYGHELDVNIQDQVRRRIKIRTGNSEGVRSDERIQGV